MENLVYTTCWTFCRIIFKIFFRYEIFSKSRQNQLSGVLIASNHISYLDPPIVGVAFKKPIFYFARSTLMKKAPGSWLLPRLNCLPVNRGGISLSSIKNVISLIRQGKNVLIFPEGTRSIDGKIGTAETGIGLLIAKTQAPVLPVKIIGAYEAFPRDSNFPKFKKISLKIGKIIEFRANQFQKNNKTTYQNISNKILEEIKKL